MTIARRMIWADAMARRRRRRRIRERLQERLRERREEQPQQLGEREQVLGEQEQEQEQEQPQLLPGWMAFDGTWVKWEWRTDLPKRDCILSCGYIPTFFLDFLKEHPFSTLPELWKDCIILLIHALLPPQRSQLERKVKVKRKVDLKRLQELEDDEVFMQLFGTCMPFLKNSDRFCLKDLKHELRKHLPQLPFLDEVEYPKFAIKHYIRLELDDLMPFVCREINRSEAARRYLLEDERLGKDWRGVRLLDLINVSHSYPKLVGSQLSFQLEECDWDIGKGKFLLKEVRLGLTEHGEFACNPLKEPYTVYSKNGQLPKGIAIKRKWRKGKKRKEKGEPLVKLDRDKTRVFLKYNNW